MECKHDLKRVNLLQIINVLKVNETAKGVSLKAVDYFEVHHSNQVMFDTKGARV